MKKLIFLCNSFSLIWGSQFWYLNQYTYIKNLLDAPLGFIYLLNRERKFFIKVNARYSDFLLKRSLSFFYKKFCKTPVSTFEFRISWLKSSFFAEVNSFKNKYLNSYSNDVSINNSERLIKQLQDNINFLR